MRILSFAAPVSLQIEQNGESFLVQHKQSKIHTTNTRNTNNINYVIT